MQPVARVNKRQIVQSETHLCWQYIHHAISTFFWSARTAAYD